VKILSVMEEMNWGAVLWVQINQNTNQRNGRVCGRIPTDGVEVEGVRDKWVAGRLELECECDG
jgi:hypothetical protein